MVIKPKNVRDKTGFSSQLRVEAQGFFGGICMFWRSDVVTVTTYESHSQHLIMEIRKVGDDPWLFSVV